MEFHICTLKDSSEELGDLKSAYIENEGNMDDIIDTVLCATIDDEPRFTKTLKGLIKKKEIPDFPAFSKEGKSKKNARKRKVREVRAQTSMSSGYFTLNSCYSFE